MPKKRGCKDISFNAQDVLSSNAKKPLSHVNERFGNVPPIPRFIAYVLSIPALGFPLRRLHLLLHTGKFSKLRETHLFAHTG